MQKIKNRINNTNTQLVLHVDNFVFMRCLKIKDIYKLNISKTRIYNLYRLKNIQIINLSFCHNINNVHLMV